MDGERLITMAREAKIAFGVKCSKFAGAVTVEILKAALLAEGIPTSPRDVFVRGIPVEIDLVVPRHGQQPVLGLLYEPQQVAVVLEVKNSGSFGSDAVEKIRNDFSRCREVGIACAYVTFEERRRHPWAASAERLGAPCFTLAWHRTSGGPIEATQEWADLLKFLQQCTRA
jgi:hypothetical protein